MIKKYMLKALKESNITLKTNINNKLNNWEKCENDYLVFKAETETIHWLIDCIERIDKKNIKNEDLKIFSAFKFINNALKHNETLTHLDIVKGFVTFPLTFPFPNTMIYQWIDLSYLKNVKNISQQKNYDELLKEKDVLKTLDDAIERVEKYIEK